MNQSVKHCGSCRYLDTSDDFLPQNKRGWYRCSKVSDAKYMVDALKAVRCSMYQRVVNLDERRELLRKRKNG